MPYNEKRQDSDQESQLFSFLRTNQGGIMDLNEAIKILSEAKRYELRDNSFGDREVSWTKNTRLVATGYFGDKTQTVSLIDHITQQPLATFEGEIAKSLVVLGTDVTIERNDETGPDEFVEGHIEPGLTKEAVLEEITRHPSNHKKES
jgi:hypothetical protein